MHYLHLKALAISFTLSLFSTTTLSAPLSSSSTITKRDTSCTYKNGFPGEDYSFSLQGIPGMSCDSIRASLDEQLGYRDFSYACWIVYDIFTGYFKAPGGAAASVGRAFCLSEGANVTCLQVK